MTKRRLILFVTMLQMYGVLLAQYCDTNLFPDGKPYYDTYHHVENNLAEWKHYNTHDPTLNKQGEWYYMYSTDASWSNRHETGALKRRSKDLVNWDFLGNAFDGVPQSAQDFFINGDNPDYTDIGIWAPFLFSYKGKYILYYSAPGGLNGVNLAYLGYATSDSAGGTWVDQGMITSSHPGDTINAIDPTVIYDSLNHQLWMAYGSWHTGIYMVELDTATGGIGTPGDRGVKIASRIYTSYGIEGSELCYRNGWYYLFVSYDPLGDVYNVRVGRSRNATGPYLDFNGADMAELVNCIPMVQAPYRFNDHPGWQGTGHCGVYNENGNYFMANQGRPSIEPAMMVLHTRKIFWIDDWPVLSPERYAGVPECEITADTLMGIWEHMPLQYKTNPGNFHSRSIPLEIKANGTFNSNTANTWTFDNDTLFLNWSNGDVQKLITHWGYDWENSCRTLLYTGIDTEGACIWGKKINQTEAHRYTDLIDGATYTIRNLRSHLLMHVPNNADVEGAAIRQGADNGLSSQLWKIKDAGDGYFFLLPHHSVNHLVLEVYNGNPDNGSSLLLGTLNGTEKQKFRIAYNDNGYFHILTKASNDMSCADVVGFSVAEGGTIAQYTYQGFLNQLWRFSRVDSIPIDTVSIDTFTVDAVEAEELSALRMYPNPSSGGKITLDLSSIQTGENCGVSLIDLNGTIVYEFEIGAGRVYELDVNLPRGIYLVRIKSDYQQYHLKLIIQ